MKQEKGNFEFVKESSNEEKRNYILQNDKITVKTATFVVIVLILLTLGVIFIPKIVG